MTAINFATIFCASTYLHARLHHSSGVARERSAVNLCLYSSAIPIVGPSEIAIKKEVIFYTLDINIIATNKVEGHEESEEKPSSYFLGKADSIIII